MTISAYNDHPVRAAVQELLQLQTESAMAEPGVVEDEGIRFARDKTFAMAQAIQSLLESTPALLVSTHALNAINKQIRAPINELIAYITDKNPAHITTASNQMEQSVLPNLWGFAKYFPMVHSDGLSDLLERMSASTSATIQQLSKERDNLAERVNASESAAQALNARLEAMSEAAARERAEASAAVAKLEQAFAEKETERAATFEAAVSKIKADYSSLEEETKGSSTSLIRELEDQKGKAAQIVQVVGNIGVTGNYRSIATSEARQADFWRWASVAFFTAGVALAIATFVRFWGAPVTAESIWSILVRLLYAIAITAPAWYTAKESARHRTNSDRARQTELELASLGPFIELLPPEKKIEIREQMTKLYFGREVEAHTAKALLDAKDLKDVLIECLKTFKK